MNIEEFNRRVATDPVERNALAIEGDALLRYEAIRFVRKKYPDSSAHVIHLFIQQLLQNNVMSLYLRLYKIEVPKNLLGKERADYFEAWIGYLNEVNPVLASRFCAEYTKAFVHSVPEFDLESWTRKLTENRG